MSDYIFYVKVANSKFELDAVSQAEIALGHSLTYRFDQSDSSNASHPLRFSTTTDGTHTTGGAEYTTGVTTAGTPGSSGAYTEIAVTSSTAASLYYYCSQHSGMGAAVITTGDTHVTTNNLGLLVPILADATDQWGSHINQSLRKLESNFGANANVYTFSISSTTSTISGAATIGGTLSFSAQQHVEVYLNGVKLVEKSGSTGDFTLSPSTNTITLESSVSSGDVVDVVCLKTFLLADAVPASGGTFTGGVTFEGQNTHNTGNNTFTMPTTRGDNNYVLTRDDSIGTGGTTWKESMLSPTITSIKYSNQTSGTFAENSGQTATDPAGGDLVQLTGTNFDSTLGGNSSNVAITIDGTSATSISVNSAKTEVTFAPPAKSAGSYTLTATNGSGLNATTTIVYDSVPSWTATGALGTFINGSGYTNSSTPNIRIQASEGSDTITYRQTDSSGNTITSGVAGLTLGTSGANAGYLTGTLNGTDGQTQNFYAIATDAENQDSAPTLFNIITRTYAGAGGDSIVDPGSYTGGGYRSHTWTTVGTHTNDFTLYTATTVDILIVAGGGGGGSSHNVPGGGGGGGVLIGSKSLAAGSYTIVVGDGGLVGSNGGNSSAFGATAVGGGRGGAGDTASAGAGVGADGGSGGGGLYAENGGSGTQSDSGGLTGYGNNGASGGPTGGSNGYPGGGGGGAGSAATTPSTTSTPGDGGNGIANYYRDGNTSGTTAGIHIFAGGGGGGGWVSISQAQGGSGGGGDGALNDGSTASTAGGANTGGGGGGGSQSSNPSSRGGSGIVVVRYQV